MDVRCERCKTEYDFDDSKITDAGVTVRCTTCNHVFRVKKRALVVMAPAGDETMPAPGPSSKRDWKVRKANGDVFTFKELTTLQKWIVERKVSREDEISLTGDSWKRLGNIAELASFFQVVEAADRAMALPAVPAAPPQQVAPYPATFSGFPQQGPAIAPTSLGPPMMNPQPQAAYVPQPTVGPTTGMGPVPQPPQAAWEAARQPPPTRPAATDEALADDAKAAGVRRNGALKLLLVAAVLGAAGTGGWYYYTRYYRPAHRIATPPGPVAVTPPEAPKPPEPAPAAPPTATAPKPEEPKLPESPKPPEVVKPAEPGTPVEPTKPPAAAKPGEPTKKPEVEAGAPPKGKTFEWYLETGQRLRERGKPQQALNLFGSAADMNPDSAEPIAGRGLCLIDMGMFPQAIAAFEKALKINDRFGDAIMGLAEAYKYSGDKQKALAWYEKYLAVSPEGPEAGVAKTNIERLKE